MPEAGKETSCGKLAKFLTEEQKEIVRETWKEAAKSKVEAGLKLFKRLFQISLEAASYFNSDIESDEFKDHIKRVISTLHQAVQSLDNLTDLLPALERLGTIHANMRIKKQQFAVVKEALLFTLSQELNDVFNDKCQRAWELTFDILADAMATEWLLSSKNQFYI